MTDERIPDLAGTIARLPQGAGIVFRHYATPPKLRRSLFKMVKHQARQWRLVLLLADKPAKARAWGADGAHNRSGLASLGLRSVAVHNGGELALARRVRADLVFVSPVFATRSHDGAKPMGPVRLGLLVGSDRSRTIALGGMTKSSWSRVRALTLHGWAAIDGLS